MHRTANPLQPVLLRGTALPGFRLGLIGGLFMGLVACEGSLPEMEPDPFPTATRVSDQDIPQATQIAQPAEPRGDIAAALRPTNQAPAAPDFQDADNPAKAARAWAQAQLPPPSRAGSRPTAPQQSIDDSDVAAQDDASTTAPSAAVNAHRQSALTAAEKLPDGRDGIAVVRDVRPAGLGSSVDQARKHDINGREIDPDGESRQAPTRAFAPAAAPDVNLDANGRPLPR